MDTPLHYTKSPLTEAVLDLRVQLPASITADSWQALYCKIKDVYPEQRERLYMEGEIEFGPEIRSSGKQTVEGYEFISKDKKQYIYVGLNGFSFNRLAPYQTWDEFRDEARRLWMLYREFANPE